MKNPEKKSEKKPVKKTVKKTVEKFEAKVVGELEKRVLDLLNNDPEVAAYLIHKYVSSLMVLGLSGVIAATMKPASGIGRN